MLEVGTEALKKKFNLLQEKYNQLCEEKEITETKSLTKLSLLEDEVAQLKSKCTEFQELKINAENKHLAEIENLQTQLVQLQSEYSLLEENTEIAENQYLTEKEKLQNKHATELQSVLSKQEKEMKGKKQEIEQLKIQNTRLQSICDQLSMVYLRQINDVMVDHSKMTKKVSDLLQERRMMKATFTIHK